MAKRQAERILQLKIKRKQERIFMKIGIICCMQTEDYCPGTTDFKAVRDRKGVFGEVPEGESIEIVGF